MRIYLLVSEKLTVNLKLLPTVVVMHRKHFADIVIQFIFNGLKGLHNTVVLVEKVMTIFYLFFFLHVQKLN